MVLTHLISFVILSALFRATVSIETKDRTECHKLNVINSNGTCPDEGQFLVPGNCTIYVDCISNGSELIPHEFHCSMGYFNGTRCTELDEMIMNCPQTDCFSGRAGNGEMMTEYVLEFESNHTQSTMHDDVHSMNVLDRPGLHGNNATSNSSMADMLGPQAPENRTTMMPMKDEPTKQNQTSFAVAETANTMEQEDTALRIDILHQSVANETNSSNETEMVHPSASNDRHGRLIIKDMRLEITRNKSMTETTINSSSDHLSTMKVHEHHHEHHQVEDAPESTAAPSTMKAPVGESNTMTSMTAKSTSGTGERMAKEKPAELQQMKSMETNAAVSSALQNPKVLLLAIIITITIF